MSSSIQNTRPMLGPSTSSDQSARWRIFTILSVVFTSIVLSPSSLAVTPPPDGGYSGNNTAEGTKALFSLTSGTDNTALGFNALYSDTSGLENTATGSYALALNIGGSENSAYGTYALQHNIDGYSNTAMGRAALAANTSGYFNTASGEGALQSNTTGYLNTGVGAHALLGNSDGFSNTAVGQNALVNNTSGDGNTAIGAATLVNNNGNNNTAIGSSALPDSMGSNNIAVGSAAGTNILSGNNNICIGALGSSTDTATMRLGAIGVQNKTFIAGVYGTTSSGGVAVYINSNGRLGTATSSARFKHDIHDMANQSDALLSLRPVAFRYKEDVDPAQVPQFGLVAEEVEKIDPDLIVRDAEGRPYTVRYEAVNAMLLNEFLKEHRTVDELKSKAAKQDATIAEQQKQIEALKTGLQKVNDKLELSRPAPRTVNNDQ